MAEEWIRGKAVWTLLRDHRPEWPEPEGRLREALKFRHLQCLAGRASIGDALRGGEVTEADWLVPSEVWWSKDPPYFSLLGDTISGHLPHSSKPFNATMLTFEKSDLLLFADVDSRTLAQPIADTTPAASSNPRRGGRYPDKEAWGRFAAALAVIAQSEVDLSEAGVSANSIHEKVDVLVREFTGEDALGIDSVRDAITLAQEWARRGRG